MAYGTYVIHAASDKMDWIEKSIATAIDTTAGPPLGAVSPTRAILGPVYAEALARTAPEKTLEEIVRGFGAQWLEPITPDRVADLLSWREPMELRGGRAPRHRRHVDGYDWHLHASRLVQAWERVGQPGAIDWRDIIVGQIDTGYTEHPCLGWRNGVSAWVDTSRDRNFFSRELSSDPETGSWANRDPLSALDPLTGAHGGHGTRTGSVLSGFDVSAEAQAGGPDGGPPMLGYFGAAPCVPYVPIRISNTVWINESTDALARAIEHLINEVGCQVITISMGATLPAYLPQHARDMIDRAYANGVIVCCAAGNMIDSVVTPAKAPRTIAVAGSAYVDPGRVPLPWAGSSFGRFVDIAAPAWPIWRASVTTQGVPEYGYGDGTSFATPQVAGTAALWLHHRGQAIDLAYPERWMRVAAFLELLRQTASIPSGWDTTKYGHGLLNARGVLDAPLPDPASLRRDVEPHP